METLIILVALATVAIPALTEAAVAAPRLFAGHELARKGGNRQGSERPGSERLSSEGSGSEKLADL
jgi:hypothetical protein